MSSGKKGKKKKSKTVDLNTFLADGGTTPTVSVKLSSWNEEMEEEHEGYLSRSSKEPVVLPTAPRAARGPRIADEDIPTNPPYVAYLSNLPYEVDESYLTEFFADMKIASIRLPKDSTKLKGYGYVEFEDRQSLVDALCLSNTPMKTRRVRIDLSNNVNDERRGGRMGRDNRRDNYDDPERTSGDWRSGPRDETPSDGDSYRPRYDNRDRRDDRESSDNDNKPGAWRESSERGRPTFRDRAGFREDERDRDWSRYDRGSRDREGDRGNSFGQRRNYGDSDREWDRDGPRRQGKPTAENVAGEPRTRPKLQLQPRTKPIEPIAAKEEQQQQSASGPTPASGPAPASGPVPASASAPTPTPTPAPAPAPAPASSTNIFGAAKPVDTTAREREIEERLAKSYAESKSKEDGDSEKRGPKEGTWGRRNGEGRDEKERSRAWRTEDNSRRNEISAPQNQASHSDQYGDSKPSSRGGRPSSRGPPKSNDARGDRDKDRRDREKDDVSKMPKAKDEQTPNFAASNKYSMLPNDVDPDNDD